MSFFDLFRRRKAPSLTDILPDSPEDWVPGDIAVCVGPLPWICIDGGAAIGPNEGQSLPVKAILLVDDLQFLIFEAFAPRFYHAAAFVKVRPDERKACDPAFNKLIRKRSRERIDA